jgi:transglutaminase-like putative cysteine protease
MRFRVTADLQYNLTGDATYFFAFKCVETGGQHIASEQLNISPEVATEEFTVGVGMNRFTKLEISANGPLQVTYEAEVETSHSLVNLDSLQVDGTQSLVPDAIPYLFPSRYCQSDRLRQQAMDLFGGLQGRYAIAAGISDWIFEHVTYQSGSSNEQSSAVDTLEQRQGVCRDFAHLGIGFCRAMNIPARYVSVYSHLLQPPDFHAVFEVFIGGMWYLLDPTRLAPLNGFVRIATGRDAADVSVATVFGASQFQSSVVNCEALDGEYEEITRDSLAAAGQAIALL